MWDTPNRLKLKQVWHSGVGEAVDEMVTLDSPTGSMASGVARKAYMPNIVMIDFVNHHRCDFIYGLNHATADDLRQMQSMDQAQAGGADEPYTLGYEVV